jgi:hypothetical protein
MSWPKVVEHGADGGDDGEFADVVPGGRDRRAHQIGGERKFKGEQDPGGEFEPDLAPARAVRLALPDRFRHERERLRGAESDDEHGAGLNDERNEFGNLLELAIDRHG